MQQVFCLSRIFGIMNFLVTAIVGDLGGISSFFLLLATCGLDSVAS